jgi:hypothetical protein
VSPLTERELFAGLRGQLDESGVLLGPAPEVVELLEAMAREVAVCRELLELLVDWAGARDRPQVDEP